MKRSRRIILIASLPVWFVAGMLIARLLRTGRRFPETGQNVSTGAEVARHYNRPAPAPQDAGTKLPGAVPDAVNAAPSPAETGARAGLAYHDAREGHESAARERRNAGVRPPARVRLAAASTSISVPRNQPPAFLALWTLGDYRYGRCRPTSAAVDRSGNLFAVMPNDNAIYKYDRYGHLLTKWGGPGRANGQFRNPRGIAVDRDGNVFVADTGNERVQKFDDKGNFVSKWGHHAVGNSLTGYDNGGFFMPSSIATDAAGNVYVADESLATIQKFDNSGHFILKWGGPRAGRGNGQFVTPDGLAVDAANDVYVVDRGNNRIQKFDARGRFLTKWGESGRSAGEFLSPRGVVIDLAGNVYVLDEANHRVEKFDRNGAFLTQWGSRGHSFTGRPKPGRLLNPVNLAIDRQGDIFVLGGTYCLIQKFGTPASSRMTERGPERSANPAAALAHAGRRPAVARASTQRGSGGQRAQALAAIDFRVFRRPDLMRSLILKKRMWGIELISYAYGVTNESNALSIFVYAGADNAKDFHKYFPSDRLYNPACNKWLRDNRTFWETEYHTTQHAIKRKADADVNAVSIDRVVPGIPTTGALITDYKILRNARRAIKDGQADIATLMNDSKIRCNRDIMTALLENLRYLSLSDEAQREIDHPKTDREKKCARWKYMAERAEEGIRTNPGLGGPQKRDLENRHAASRALQTLFCTNEMTSAESCNYWRTSLSQFDDWTQGLSYRGWPKESVQFYEDSGNALKQRVRATCGAATASSRVAPAESESSRPAFQK